MRRAAYFLPWVVGAVLRAIAALSGFGWFAADDYAYVIHQAGNWLEDPQAAFGSDLRSAFFSRFFWLLMLAAQRFGLTDPAAMLRFAYACLGLLSSLAIPAAYKLGRRHSAEAGRAAAWLVACFALMPHIGTRALVEGAAMVPLLWAAVFVDDARDTGAGEQRWREAGAAGALLGFATVLRFQVIILFPAAFLLLAWPAGGLRQAAAWRTLASNWRQLASFCGGGAAAVCLQVGIDVAQGRAPFDTWWAYSMYNIRHSGQFGLSPWYTYLLQFLFFTAPPATLMLLVPLWRAARENLTAMVLWATFVGVHSAIGHKEDRFMFPVLPLFLVLLGGALVHAGRGGYASRAAVRLFWLINIAALTVVTLSDGQRSVTLPLLAIQRAGGAPRIAAVGIGAVPLYYLHGLDAAVNEYASLESFYDELGRTGKTPDYVLLRPPPNDDTVAALARFGCHDPTLYPGDWVDRLLVRVNRHNGRRAATALMSCDARLRTR